MNITNSTRAALLAAVCGLGILTSAQAQSTFVSDTIIGVFNAGSVDDQGWLTGIPGFDLTGVSFIETISFQDTPFTQFQPTFYFKNGSANTSITTLGHSVTVGGRDDGKWQVIRADNSTHSALEFAATDAVQPSPVHIFTTIYSANAFSGQGIATQAGLDSYLIAAANYSPINQLYIDDIWSNSEILTFNITSVPEPTSMALLLCGITTLVVARRRQS